MRLIDYIADRAQRRELAGALGTSPNYLWQMAANWNKRRVPAERVFEVCALTGGRVNPHGVRPDLYPDPDYRPAMPDNSAQPRAEAA